MNSELNKIPSFTIDHERLLRGIYVSRKEKWVARPLPPRCPYERTQS